MRLKKNRKERRESETCFLLFPPTYFWNASLLLALFLCQRFRLTGDAKAHSYLLVSAPVRRAASKRQHKAVFFPPFCTAHSCSSGVALLPQLREAACACYQRSREGIAAHQYFPAPTHCQQTFLIVQGLFLLLPHKHRIPFALKIKFHPLVTHHCVVFVSMYRNTMKEKHHIFPSCCYFIVQFF